MVEINAMTGAPGQAQPGQPSHGIALSAAISVWARIGLLGFGGPAGQIALMHRILVEEKRWIGEERFLHALNFCTLLPGPEAQQLATYIGWILHRTLGGVIAGTLFVLPGFLVILVMSALYANFHDLTAVQAIFFGIKAAVLAVVIEAIHRIGKRALKNGAMVAIAAGAFLALFVFDIAFPIVIVIAGLIGAIGARFAADIFIVARGHGKTDAGATIDAMLADGVRPAHTLPSLPRAVIVTLVCVVLWVAPIIAAGIGFGATSVFVEAGLFFSKMAVVTFGGAYAVLAYVAQEAVEKFSWLAPGEMLDGLGLAETTPGPLILVLEYVGYLAAFRNPAGLTPWVAGVLGATLTVWVTFVPCFLWIFLGAPYFESLRDLHVLNAALSAITAAVVGVILNLSIWFALHVVFLQTQAIRWGWIKLDVPVWSSIDVGAAGLAAAALIALFRFKVDMLPVLSGCAIAGAAWYLAVGR